MADKNDDITNKNFVCNECGCDTANRDLCDSCSELTRVFFTVTCAEHNPEIFETLEGANAHAYHLEMKGATEISTAVALVRNAYREEEGWNYDDHSDTFNWYLDIT